MEIFRIILETNISDLFVDKGKSLHMSEKIFVDLHYFVKK